MASTFQNPRWYALPCERMLSCSFADNLVTLADILKNRGVDTGAGNTADHGLTTTGTGYIEYDIQSQPGGFSVKIKFKTTVRSSPGLLIGNMDGGGGFSVQVTATGIRGMYYNGVDPPEIVDVVIDYTDGEVHTATYVADQAGGNHYLYVDDLDVETTSTTVNEEIGTTDTVKVGGDGVDNFTGTVYEARVLDALLTEADHDVYHAGTLTSFGDNPFAVYRCDEICDDTDGDKIWERGLNDRDLYKADRVAGAKFPTFSATPTPRYTFDGADDYVSNVPTLPSAYTTTAALESVAVPRPWIQQDNDAAFLDDISVEGDHTGILHSLAIHSSELSPLQLLQDEYQHLYWLDREIAWGLYHRLITEETCQLVMFLGSDPVLYKDYSRNLYSGVATLVTNNGVDGCEFNAATSRITVADAVPLRSIQGTISVFGDFAGVEAAGHLCDKGTGLEFETNGNQLDFMGSTIAHVFDDNEMIAVTYKTGFKPRFFVDGYYIGEGTVIVSPTLNATDFIIGNSNAANHPTPYPLTQFYYGVDPLTDDEIYALWSNRRSISP